MKASLLCLACAGLLNLTAPAVVVFTGLSNTTAPPGQPFFGNVGSVNGASAIYLGEQLIAIIPEPSAALGTAWVLGLVLLRRRRSIPAWS